MISVIIDSREQKPYSFASCEYIDDIIVRKLDTGDYSIDGMEDLLCIERKMTVSELAMCLTKSRFTRELERMTNYKYRYLLCEFDYYHIDVYPENSDIPPQQRKKVKIKGPFIRSKLIEITMQYGVNIILCGNHSYAEDITATIMKKTWERENGKNKNT
jgi:ERCC4-type nuclease